MWPESIERGDMLRQRGACEQIRHRLQRQREQLRDLHQQLADQRRLLDITGVRAACPIACAAPPAPFSAGGCEISTGTRGAGLVAGGAVDASSDHGGRGCGDFPVIAVATSAGGLRALPHVLSGLPADLPAAILLALHRGCGLPTLLPQVLQRCSVLPVVEAYGGLRIRPGVVILAPPGHHLLVRANCCVHLRPRGAAGHAVCPSADLLFESLAAAFGPRALAVVMTGMGDDGALGTRHVRRGGGLVIAQDEPSADFPDMPLAAREVGLVDLVLPLREIAPALVQLCARDADEVHPDFPAA